MIVDLVPIKSREEAEAAMALVTAAHIELKATIALQNEELQAARKHDEKIREARERIDKYVRALEPWTKEQTNLMDEKKSIDLAHGTVGFRTSNRKTRFLQGWTSEKCLEVMRKSKRLRNWIRTKQEVNFQLILVDSRPEVGKLKEKDLQKIGVEVWREESFYVEPKVETGL